MEKVMTRPVNCFVFALVLASIALVLPATRTNATQVCTTIADGTGGLVTNCTGLTSPKLEQEQRVIDTRSEWKDTLTFQPEDLKVEDYYEALTPGNRKAWRRGVNWNTQDITRLKRIESNR
jgi:hypothetical protein